METEETKILTEQKLKEYFGNLFKGNSKFELSNFMNVVEENLNFYEQKEVNIGCIKLIYLQSSFWMSRYIDEQDFKNASKIAHLLNIYVYEDNIGVIDYVRFFQTYIFLLSSIKDYNRFMFEVDGFVGYLKHTKKNNIKQMVRSSISKINDFNRDYIYLLHLLVGIFTYAGAVSNSIGLVSNAGKYYYLKKYYEGLVFLNCGYVSSIDEAMRPGNMIGYSWKMSYAVVDTDKSWFEKFKRFSVGLLNRLNLYTTGYGEKASRVIYTIVLSIILFGIVYQFCGLTNTNDLFKNIFFSVFTFTSFGLYQPFESRIIIPNNELFSMIIFTTEIILGIILNGVFIVALSRKIMR